MAKYVDGFVIPLPKKNLKAYRKMANWGAKTWKKLGALDYYECVGDDLKLKFGLPFPKLCKLKKTETVIFAFIVYKSKADRNRINKKIMKEHAHECSEMPMPFSMKRFSMGGFKVLVES